MTPEQAAALREPFPASAIGKLPKGGMQLDYVGHAAVTDRLLDVDAEWKWEPDRDEHGRWDVQVYGNDAVLTGTLTVCGVTRPCVGTASAKAFDLHKQLQSDAIRNGAMRFGVALDLWSKEDLHDAQAPEQDVVSAADAKQRLIDASDVDTAKRLWGKRGRKPIPADELAELEREARLEAAVVTSNETEGESTPADFADDDPGRPFTEDDQ